MPKTPGQILFEACQAEGLIQDLRTWNGRDWHESEPGWQSMTAALRGSEQVLWERAAKRIERAALTNA